MAAANPACGINISRQLFAGNGRRLRQWNKSRSADRRLRARLWRDNRIQLPEKHDGAEVESRRPSPPRARSCRDGRSRRIACARQCRDHPAGGGMNWLEELMRPDLRSFAPYRSARLESDGFAAAIGIDANEFPWPPFGPAATRWKPNRYPEAQPKELLRRLAAIWNVKPDCILLGRGSDEGIDTLLRLFCRAGRDQVLICPPTYG